MSVKLLCVVTLVESMCCVFVLAGFAQLFAAPMVQAAAAAKPSLAAWLPPLPAAPRGECQSGKYLYVTAYVGTVMCCCVGMVPVGL